MYGDYSNMAFIRIYHFSLCFIRLKKNILKDTKFETQINKERKICDAILMMLALFSFSI